MNVNLRTKLSRSFYARETVEVAYDLIGKRIIRHLDGETLTGRIIETEAYRSKDDAASHAFRGRTKRNAPMFGLPGTTYIYLIYGMHWLFNISAHIENIAGGILIRAIDPEQGLTKMQSLRGTKSPANLANGPARLAQALNLDKTFNTIDLVTHPELYLTEGSLLSDETITSGPRIRVSGDPVAKNRPWRFWIKNHPLISA